LQALHAVEGEKDDERQRRVAGIGLHPVEEAAIEAPHRGQEARVLAERGEKSGRRRPVAELLADEKIEIGADQGVGRPGALGLALAERLVEGGEKLLDQRLEELRLRRKMVEEPALGDPGPGGDRIEREIPRSRDPCQFLGGGENLVPGPQTRAGGGLGDAGYA